jgi:hypothetical protein
LCRPSDFFDTLQDRIAGNDTALRWLVLAVVAYIAVTLLRAGLRERPLVPQTVVVRTRHEPRIWI